MREGVFVADLQTWNPPSLHIRMVAVRDVHVLPPTQLSFVAMIEHLHPVQIVKIPEGRPVLSIDLERVQGFVPARVSCRFERRERSVLESTQKRARVVD